MRNKMEMNHVLVVEDDKGDQRRCRDISEKSGV